VDATATHNSRIEAETISVEKAARRLGIGRSLAFQLVREGKFPVPVIRAGRRRILVPTRAIDKLLLADN
jgi:excisionase family DNA binding protein